LAEPVKTTQSPNVTSTLRQTRSNKKKSSSADGSLYSTPTEENEDKHISDEDVHQPTPKSRNVTLDCLHSESICIKQFFYF
jgi:hypothetical protein